jgi:hypothetical protein
MKKFDQNISEIVDFIFKKPEVVVRILQSSGYSIDMKTATLQQIDRLTFEALEKKDERFAYNLADAIINGDAYSNAVTLAIGAVVSLASAMISSNTAKKEGRLQRELMWNMKMSELATQEKIAFEQIRTEAETQRFEIIANSVRKYREALQKEGTIRLRDTWIYIAGLGCAVGIIYALSLMLSKSKSNANG